MSAWYVFSALGFYPVCPGDLNYIIGSPIFDKATLHLASGKTFVIKTENNGPQHSYIRSADLNGALFNRTYFSHRELLEGGQLRFTMASAPNYEWGSSKESRPPSALSSLTKDAATE
jgi:putative alpha-1,2-mannosidase